MKKTITAAAIALTAFTGTAFADQHGGFKGPDRTEQVTVAQALELGDDSQVRLTGQITESLGDEKYRFQDDSGTMTVEIDNAEWRGIEATPDTRLTLWGELDKDWNETELDVERIELAQ